MPFVVQSRVVKPPTRNIAQVRQELLNEMRKEITQTKRLFQSVVQHWQNEKPEFDGQVITEGGDFRIVVGAVKSKGGTDHAVNKFIWLDKGTKFRYPTMSGDFVRKTHPNSMSTNPGNTGRPYFKPDYLQNPNPGIEARNWTKTIRSMRAVPYKNAIRRAVRRGMKKAGY
jgi:hypothetical protein